MRDPESFTPASRLIIDSVRSPKRDPKKFRNPKATALKSRSDTNMNSESNDFPQFTGSQERLNNFKAQTAPT